jgi:GAF domain-containing protein
LIMLNWQPNDHFSEPDLEPEPEQGPREKLLGGLIVGQTIAVSLLTVMTAIGGLLSPGSGLFALMPLGAVAVIVGLVSYWLYRRRLFELGSYVLLIGTSVAITSNVYVRGYQDSSGIYYLWPILGAVTLLEARGGILVALISAIAYLTLVALQQLGYQIPPLPYDPQREVMLTVASRVLMFFLLAFLGWLTSQNLRRALQQARQAAWRWRDLNEALEQHVADRTRDLERRARYLETTIRVARDTSSVLDLQNLLTRVVTLVSERFGFYHAGVFLVDPAGEWAVLQSASSEGGQRMLARGHRLRVGEEGIVGYVTGRGEPRIALDVGADAVFFDNPYLPDTRSEMALPLRARGEIIGALDVQSKDPQAFSDEDVAVLQALADQVAMAISNAQLFQQAQESLEVGRRAFGEISREAWVEMLRVQPNLGFLSDQRGIFPVGDLWEPQMEAVLQTGEATPGDGDGTTMAMPIKVRGQVIGVVDAQKPGESSEWTAEEVALMEMLAEQLGLALEGARLYQDTRRRAERERLTGEVTAHIRETLDLDIVLQTAVHDISEALGLAALDVRLDVETGLENASE